MLQTQCLCHIICSAQHSLRLNFPAQTPQLYVLTAVHIPQAMASRVHRQRPVVVNCIMFGHCRTSIAIARIIPVAGIAAQLDFH